MKRVAIGNLVLAGRKLAFAAKNPNFEDMEEEIVHVFKNYLTLTIGLNEVEGVRTQLSESEVPRPRTGVITAVKLEQSNKRKADQ